MLFVGTPQGAGTPQRDRLTSRWRITMKRFPLTLVLGIVLALLLAGCARGVVDAGPIATDDPDPDATTEPTEPTEPTDATTDPDPDPTPTPNRPRHPGPGR
jgi:hypothetical protein